MIARLITFSVTLALVAASFAPLALAGGKYGP